MLNVDSYYQLRMETSTISVIMKQIFVRLGYSTMIVVLLFSVLSVTASIRLH
jgi:hypothetical protein